MLELERIKKLSEKLSAVKQELEQIKKNSEKLNEVEQETNRLKLIINELEQNIELIK